MNWRAFKRPPLKRRRTGSKFYYPRYRRSEMGFTFKEVDELREERDYWVKEAAKYRDEADEMATEWGKLYSENNRLAEHVDRLNDLLDAEQEKSSELRELGTDWQRYALSLKKDFARYREYTKALVATLMHERQHGPTPGAPGTEANSEPFIQWSGKRTVNFGKKA